MRTTTSDVKRNSTDMSGTLAVPGGSVKAVRPHASGKQRYDRESDEGGGQAGRPSKDSGNRGADHLSYRDQEKPGSQPGGWNLSKDTDRPYQDHAREHDIGRTEERRADVSRGEHAGDDREQRHRGGHREERPAKGGRQPEAARQVTRGAAGESGDPDDRPEEGGSRLAQTPSLYHELARKGPVRGAGEAQTEGGREERHRTRAHAGTHQVGEGQARSPRTIVRHRSSFVRFTIFAFDSIGHGPARHDDRVPHQ